MTDEQLNKLVTFGSVGAVASLLVNIPHLFGYDKIYQIVAFGAVSFGAMCLSFIRARRAANQKLS